MEYFDTACMRIKTYLLGCAILAMAGLEEWFDPARLKYDYVPKGFHTGPGPIKGPEFGLKLAPDDRQGLIVLLGRCRMTAMPTISRRIFLETCAALAAAPQMRSAATPDIHFPAAPRDRLAVASYPFRSFMDRPGHAGIKLVDFAAMVVDKFGIHNIEPLSEHFPSTEPGYLDELRSAVEKAHSHVVNIPASVGASLYDPDGARRDKAIAGSKKWVDVAVAVGSPSIRVHIQGAGGAAPDAGRTAESLKQVADYGAARNIVINLENDDLVTEDAFFLAKAIDAVASPWLRGLPDFGNSMMKGDEDFNYKAVDAMFRRAYNISHVKDSEVENGKVFRVSMAKTFGIARAAGYRGYFSMEFEGQGGPYEGTQKLITESLADLSAALGEGR
jgi:sugar phosphate isomerase/epimerase